MIDNSTVVATLGEGRFAKISCLRTQELKLIAVKTYSRQKILDNGRVSRVLQEKAVLQQLSNPYIVQYLNTGKDDTNLYVYMEAVLGGPLHQHIYKLGGLGTANCRVYSAQLVSALLHMADKGCLHRDLKASNCVLRENGHIKLCDFGSAVDLSTPPNCVSDEHDHADLVITPRTYTIIGTVHAMAPEILCRYTHPPPAAVDGRSGYGTSVDWWALGVLIQEMLFAYVPTSADLASLHALPLEYVTPCCSNAEDEAAAATLHPLLTADSRSECESCRCLHPPNFHDVCLAGCAGAAGEENIDTLASAVCLLQQLLAYDISARWGPAQKAKIRGCKFFECVDWDVIEEGRCQPIYIDPRIGFLDLLDAERGTSDQTDEVSSSDQELFSGF